MTFVSLPGFPQEIDDMVISTAEQLSGEFPFNLDMNSGRPLGLGGLFESHGREKYFCSMTSVSLRCRMAAIYYRRW
jgi:hypothetical protein